MEKIQKLRSLKTKRQVAIYYARTGDKIWSGLKQNIPEELKDYYVFDKNNNDFYTKVEIIEDKSWFE